jgi:hypothetical protein
MEVLVTLILKETHLVNAKKVIMEPNVKASLYIVFKIINKMNKIFKIGLLPPSCPLSPLVG